MNMTLRIDPSLRRAVLAPTSVFAMGDEVSDLVLEFPHAAPDPDGLSLALRRDGPSGDVVAVATAFSAVGSHRRLLSASVSLKTTVLDAWRLEVKAAADAAAASTAASPKKAPSPLQTAWLDVSSPSEVYASCPVPILLRETSDLTELLAGAVRYDKPQALTGPEKATARANIGAGEPYDDAPLAARVEALEAKSEEDPSFGAWKSGSAVALGAGAAAQGDGTLAVHASGLDKVYLNAAAAPVKLSDAVASAADEVVSAKGYATVEAATSLASSAAGSALETANAHSDANLATAKSHSDANLATAKSYADTKASGALGDAKSYADSKAAAVEAKIPSKVSQLSNDLNFITSAQVSPGDAPGNAAQADHAYTAGRADEAYAVPWSGVSGKPTTLSGYGITDAASKAELDSVSTTATAAKDAAASAQSALATKADLVDGKVPAAQLPSFVDDVMEYGSKAEFPASGETGKIYVAKDTNLAYRWGGTDYVEISPSLALGETATTAYPGDRGKAAADLAAEAKATADAASTAAGSAYDTLYQHRDNKSNPHAVTAEQVNAYTKTAVDDKLAKKADKSALDAKQDKLTKTSDPTVGSLLLMGDRPSYGVALSATPDGTYGALAVKGADNRTSVLTPDGSPALTQALGDARYASAEALASLVPESIGKTVDGAKWALSADLVSTKTTTVAGEASCALTTQFGSASLSKVQDRLFSGTLDGIGNVAVWWDGSAWNWGTHPVPSDPTSMQSVSTDPSSGANATSLSFSDGSKATIALGAGTEVVETSHLATAEAVAAAYVPVTRTVNGKPLSADMVLTAADVGAVGSETDPLFKAWKDATNVLIGAGASTIAPVSPFVNNSVAIGHNAKTVPYYGSDGKYKESAAVAIGHGAEAHGYGVAIGKGAVSSGDDVVLGSEQTTGLIAFADPNSFVFRTTEEGTYVSKPLQSFLDKYWKKTDWLVGVPRVEIVPEGLIKCPDYMGTDGESVCFSADGNDIDDTTSRLYPDGSNVATTDVVECIVGTVADTKPSNVGGNIGWIYSFRPSASSDTLQIVSTFKAGRKGAAEVFLDFSAAAPAVSFAGNEVTVLYADGSLKPSDLAVSNRYMMELKWFSTAASGTAQRYMIVNIYKVAEAVS